jgi:hypothetical protein
MSYQITKTDGTILTQVVDGSVDQTATDLTLVGKNVSGYGQYLAENFVKILENFANTSQPNHPILGQLWYDSASGRLKVYDGNSFKVSGGTIVSSTIPTLVQGDLWIDSLRKQLYFNDGSGLFLAGPLYTNTQGLSGFQVFDVLDNLSVNHTVVGLYVNQVLLGIFSKDAFTPKSNISGFTGNVGVGFTAGSYSSNTGSIVFDHVSSKSNYLVAADGSLKAAEAFVSTTSNSGSSGILSLTNTTPLKLGPSSATEINVSNVNFSIKNTIANQNFTVVTTNNSGTFTNLSVDATNQYVGVNTAFPAASLDVNGDTIIRGNLDVKGTTTFLESTTIQIVDKNIELGNVATPSDTTADAGGIILKGATDKTFTWSNAASSWMSTDSINLAVGKSFSINGFPVLTETQLAVRVTSAPGLTSIGNLTTLQAGYVNVASSTISYVNSGSANGTITLLPKGTGTVDVSSAKITSVATPSSSTDAANKNYVDTTASSQPLGLGNIDCTGLTDAQIASTVINVIYPASERQNGTKCRIYCTISSVVYKKLYTVSAGSWSFTQNL